MQRYRINYHLIVGLAIGSVVVSVAAYYVWAWQIDRKAGLFRARSAEAHAEDDLVQAFDYQLKYVQLRPDENEAQVELANLAFDVLESGDNIANEDRSRAYQAVENTVRHSGDASVRRKLAKLIISYRPLDALGHIEDLLLEDPEDSELRALQVQALFQTKNFDRAMKLAYGLIGYDKQSDQFLPEKATITDQPLLYSRLAYEILNRDQKKGLARRVIDQMTMANPESATAYLFRSIFLSGIDEKEEASAALDEAYRLDPNDAGVLERKGVVAYGEKNYSDAQKFFEDGIEKYPDKISFYFQLASVVYANKEYDQALEVLDRGIEKFELKNSLALVDLKFNLLVKQKEYDQITRQVTALRQLGFARLKPYIDFQQTRIEVAKENWAVAAKELARVRPLLIDRPPSQAQAGYLLGICYEKLGQLDLALKTFGAVASDLPNYQQAIRGRNRIQKKLGLGETDASSGLDQQIREMVARPEEDQDWGKIDRLVDELVESHGLSESQTALIGAKVMMQRKKFREARQLLKEAASLEPDDLDIRFTAVALLAIDPDSGPSKALKQLDKIVDRSGDSTRVRQSRAGLLLRIGGEDVVEQLLALAEGIDDWTVADQVTLLSTLGLRLQQLGQLEEAERFWEKSAELTPNSLPIRMQLLDVALRRQNDEAIRKAQQTILDFVGSKDDPSYVLAEVKRLILGYGRELVTREELASVRPMLDKALEQRPQWHQLHSIYGKLLVLIGEDPTIALQRFDDALKYGPADGAAVAMQVTLLSSRGRFAEARKKLDLLPTAIRQRALGRVEAEILFRVGEEEEAFAVAEKLASKQQDSVQTQIWFADLAGRAGRFDVAIGAMRQVVRLRPADVNFWLQLITLHIRQKDIKAVEEILREAYLAIDPENIPVLTARIYAMRGQTQNAENIYLALFGDRLDDMNVNRQLAQFYLSPLRKTHEKATPYLNRILRAANEGRVENDDPNVVWARQQGTKYLAALGGYQNSVKAEQLLTQGGTDSELNIENQRLLTEILANRNDPRSKLHAIETLARVEQQGGLEKADTLRFAKLLNDTGDWGRCESLLLEAIPRYRDDQDIWSIYVSMLIDRKNYSVAENRLKHLRDLDAKSSSYVQLSARLASERGDQAGLHRLLQSMLPQRTGAVDADQLKTIRVVAYMAAEFGDHELAEELFRFYVKRNPKASFELTRFLALHGNVDEAFGQMKQFFRQRPDGVLQLVGQLLRTRRAEIGDRFDKDIQKMLTQAIRDDPDSVRRQLARAEILDVQGKYDQSIEAYDQLLERDDVPAMLRAAAMNNLGFQLALKNERLDEAKTLVNKAIETFGPVGDMLDTRALVRIARQEYALAVEDMKLATATSQDPIKYFHLAKAQMFAGNDQAALQAWEKALKLGFDPEDLPSLEQPGFQQVKEQFEGLRT